MHSYYRSRLAEAFLPEVGATRHDGPHPLTFRLTELKAGSGAPFHIINTTLNTSSSKDARLRARNGENMVLSALYCGSTGTGYRRTSNYLRGELTLSTAFAVSGAAVDPDTYATNSRPVSFLMTLLNVRLGIWVPNPRHEPRKLRWPAWYQLMLREMLGVGLDETTADGKFTISHVECIASCGTAPVIMINDDFYENVSPAQADDLIKKYESK